MKSPQARSVAVLSWMDKRAMLQASNVAVAGPLRYQARRYLTKQACGDALVQAPVPGDLTVVATVPCHDEPTILPLLESLWRAAPPAGAFEVLLLINARASDPRAVHERNQQLLDQARDFDAACGDGGRRVHGILTNLANRQAGVGLARKLAMDEAVRRLAGSRTGGGLICALDADCRVDPSYWRALTSHFRDHPRSVGASIYFEHDDAHTAATPIGRYELYMRYCRNALRAIGHPHAYHTIGSAMATTSQAYCAVGGMNRRQAGEDFYFLKKLMLLGEFHDMTATTVRPDGRLSTRTPFGTGRALRAQVHRATLRAPGLSGFQLLKPLFEGIRIGDSTAGLLAGVDPRLREFLISKRCAARLAEIRANTASPATYCQRFFAWFDGLKVRQWLNHRAEWLSVTAAARQLLAELGMESASLTDEQLARAFRELDRSGGLGDPRI